MKTLTTFCLTLVAASAFAAPAANGTSPDQDFMNKAAQGGMAEVMLGKLAASQASSPDVKKYGMQMVRDHTRANRNLMKVAKFDGVTLPTGVSDEDQQKYDQMSKLSGPAFDQAYINDMVQDHVKDVSDFQQESTSGTDERARNFATTTLPVLQMHLKMAQDMAAKMPAPPAAPAPAPAAPAPPTTASPQ